MTKDGRMLTNEYITQRAKDGLQRILSEQSSIDPRANVSTPSTRYSGIVISISSAIASIIGSAIVIYLILRSREGLKKVYHRIMFIMSICDLVLSVAIAFTTLPMPQDMIYNFEGLVYGNQFTCSLQGFTYVSAAMICCYMNGLLCIYYFCAIRLKMTDEAFRKKIEVYAYISIFLFTVTLAAITWDDGQFNPNPWMFPWCTYSAYPYWCEENDDECHESQHTSNAFRVVNASVILTLIILIGSMISIVLHVYKMDKLLALHSNHVGNRSTGVQRRRLSSYSDDLRTTKIVTQQACLYTLVVLVVWHQTILQALYVPGYNRDNNGWLNPTTQVFTLIFRPLQGFGNMIIFVSHKIIQLRRRETHLSLIASLRSVIQNPGIEPDRVVSNLILVQQHSHLGRIRFAGDVLSSDEEEEDEDDDVELDQEERTDNVSNVLNVASTQVGKNRPNSSFPIKMTSDDKSAVFSSPHDESDDILSNNQLQFAATTSQDLSGYCLSTNPPSQNDDGYMDLNLHA